MVMKKKEKVAAKWLKIDNDKFYLNSEKTAEFFNVSDRTLRHWDEKANGALKVEFGWWDIKAIVEWRNGEVEKSDAARKLKAEADLKEEQAKKAEFANSVLKEQYFEKSLVEQEWSMRVIELKNSLMSLSKKIGSEISDPDIRIGVEKTIVDEVYSYLDQYSRLGKYTPKRRSKKRGSK